MEFIRVLVASGALALIVVTAISLRVRGIKENKIKELELQKEVLELELKNQEAKIKLLEEENKKLDQIINE